MFNFKKNEPTGADSFFLDLQYHISIVQIDLNMAIKDIIIKNGCINLYPDGADKDKAIKDAEKAKEHLLSVMGVYDDWLTNYKNKLVIYPKEERTVTKEWDENRFLESHVLIERYYKGFYKTY
jgi:hypothetical protein